MLKTEEYIDYICNVANKVVKNNPNEQVQVIEGIAEVEINGIEYQVQILLEPKKNNWALEDRPTIRMTID